VPVAAWLLVVIFDIIWLISPSTNGWAARGAEVAVIVGVVAALGAAATGMADWSDTYGPERTIGLYHGALNLLAIVVYIVSAVLRLGVSTGESTPAAILGFVGIIAVIVAAYLGGDMVFGKGTDVNHTAWEQAGEGFEAVQPVDDMPENTLLRVTVAGVPVVLMKVREQYYAIAATCTHAGGPLDEGELQQGNIVQCPWHGSRFRMRDGKPVTGPATFRQPRYDVRVRNGMIELRRA
jgi:nitrite reductase/ring-hydroxylating ferredoxin subunit